MVTGPLPGVALTIQCLLSVSVPVLPQYVTAVTARPDDVQLHFVLVCTLSHCWCVQSLSDRQCWSEAEVFSVFLSFAKYGDEIFCQGPLQGNIWRSMEWYFKYFLRQNALPPRLNQSLYPVIWQVTLNSNYNGEDRHKRLQQLEHVLAW